MSIHVGPDEFHAAPNVRFKLVADGPFMLYGWWVDKAHDGQDRRECRAVLGPRHKNDRWIFGRLPEDVNMLEVRCTDPKMSYTLEFYSDGLSRPDPKPLSLPLGHTRPPTLQEEIHRIMRQERAMARAAARERDDDFEEDDDDMPLSAHEMEAMSDEEVIEYCQARGINVPEVRDISEKGAPRPPNKDAVVPPTREQYDAFLRGELAPKAFLPPSPAKPAVQDDEGDSD